MKFSENSNGVVWTLKTQVFEKSKHYLLVLLLISTPYSIIGTSPIIPFGVQSASPNTQTTEDVSWPYYMCPTWRLDPLYALGHQVPMHGDMIGDFSAPRGHLIYRKITEQSSSYTVLEIRRSSSGFIWGTPVRCGKKYALSRSNGRTKF